jgi:hypothetical protein
MALDDIEPVRSSQEVEKKPQEAQQVRAKQITLSYKFFARMVAIPLLSKALVSKLAQPIPRLSRRGC